MFLPLLSFFSFHFFCSFAISDKVWGAAAKFYAGAADECTGLELMINLELLYLRFLALWSGLLTDAEFAVGTFYEMFVINL